MFARDGTAYAIVYTDRNEIASCEETAYDSLPLKDAATLLFFKSTNDVLVFAKEVRDGLPCSLRCGADLSHSSAAGKWIWAHR